MMISLLPFIVAHLLSVGGLIAGIGIAGIVKAALELMGFSAYALTVGCPFNEDGVQEC